MILALAPGLAEKYENVSPIWKVLGLQSIDGIIAGDLKIINIISGIMAHSSAHPCPYCDTEKKNLMNSSGNLRTIGNIKENMQQWKASKCKSAKRYACCINEPLVNGADQQLILTATPTPSLHITLGIVNAIYKAVETSNQQIAQMWANKAGVRHQQRTFGFTGKACHSLMESLDALEADVALRGFLNVSVQSPFHLTTLILNVFQALNLYKRIYKACFMEKLDPGYATMIEEFGEIWENLKLPNSSKFHILRFHVKQFCDKTGQSLGVFGEQASESVHSDFTETWGRYRTPNTSKSYLRQLLSAVVDYNSGHLI